MPGDARLDLPVRPVPSARRLWFFRLLALGGSLAVGVLLIGTTLMMQERLIFDRDAMWFKLQAAPVYVQEPGSEVTGHRYLFDPVLGWRNIPNWRASTKGRPLSINSKGLRDREYPYEKPSGVSRILVLGDSFTWGYGVADGEIFTEVLEAGLRRDGLHWEVLNAGVSGWGTDQEYLYLINEGFKYAPDVVVLAFLVFNDPENNAWSVQYGLHKPIFLNKDLDLYGVPVPEPNAQVPLLHVDGDPLDVTIAIIARMAAACIAHHCRLVVMKFGMFLNPEEPRVGRWNRQLPEALAATTGLSFLDLDAAFAARGVSLNELIGGNDNGHWNAQGHRLTADILQRYLLDSGSVR
jgi:lysophospholipase L1-like esterase